MPKKPLHPTVYPKMRKDDALTAMAAIFASGAVRATIQGELKDRFEPVLEQEIVTKNTSVNCGNIELCSIWSRPQPSLFAEDEL